MTRNRVLFICTHNAARSQMAEGYLRARYGERFEAFSAGTEVSAVSPYAISVMREIGVDISGHRSKLLKEFSGVEMDVAVVVCDAAKSACPFFPWAKETIHATFRNPREFSGTDDQIRAGFREIRDEITVWIDHYVAGNA
ncbi:MAG: arsenate reductase ArsC [Methanoregulaceae archaeon]|nr:arsenate reductase ArsC [Methanoregulaceae archaeon]MCC7468273.1 arsenate reductase ArsC [Burkholderiaceae bacterium]NLH25916.1 arsenate reductase ArsC [Methanomicrobiales archaeon]HOU81357.1 arsenate reductase ArsC [Methanoregulaceae archaeon]HPS22318.1 arsenate reductase ArsC [Methanoregulaceae archaeon]